MPAQPLSLIHRVHRQPDNPPRPVKLGLLGRESLLAALSRVPDPRDARRIRHRLRAVLAMAVAAVLAGNTSLLLLEQGVELVTIKELLGHTQIHTTADVYSHVRLRMQRNAIESMGHALQPRDGDGTEQEEDDDHDPDDPPQAARV